MRREPGNRGVSGRFTPLLRCFTVRTRCVLGAVVLDGAAPLGAEAIRKQHPHDHPARSKKSPAPAVHAATKAVRKQLKQAYRLFVEAYREAAARLRAGECGVEFPPGCFPPPRPHVPSDVGLPCSRAGPARAPS